MRHAPFIVPLFVGAAVADASLPPPKKPLAPIRPPWECPLAAPPQTGPPDPPATAALTATQIVHTLSAVRPNVDCCFAAYGRADLAIVQLTVEPDGRVSRAHVAGAFDATPTGSCIEGAVRTARFPAFEGGPRPIQFAFRPR